LSARTRGCLYFGCYGRYEDCSECPDATECENKVYEDMKREVEAE